MTCTKYMLDDNSHLDKYKMILADLYTMAAKNATRGPGRPIGRDLASSGKFVPRGIYSPAPKSNATYYLKRAAYHTAQANKLHDAIIDLFWDPKKLAFYDYNVTANARSTWFSPAGYYAFWSDIVPQELKSDPLLKKAGKGVSTKAQSAFAAVRMVMSRYNGTFPSSLVQTGLQWDAPK